MPAKKKTKKRPTRPVHKRIALHPVSLMILLCTGVLIAGSTWYAHAVSYNLTATVPAPPLAAPAIINQPADQLHFSNKTITVAGACPDQSYVVLFRNSNFSGSSICSAGQFQVQTDLAVGANQLLAQDYNITDQAGPSSSPITVYYDPPPLPLPPPPQAQPQSSAPVTLEVSNIDLSNYSASDAPLVSTQPTVSGYAPPFSDIIVTFHSDPVECRTKADGKGFWTCALPSELPPGIHTVDVVAITPSGKRLVMAPFRVKVVLGLVSLVKKTSNLLAIVGDYHYRLWQVDRLTSFDVNLAGGAGPFKIFVDWGDGQTSESFEADKTFDIAHTYSNTGNYVVLVKVTDAKKVTAILQLSAAVGGTPLPAVIGSTTQGAIPRLLESLQGWLWIAWPAYIAIVLMVVSFWIGEREAYQRVLVTERIPRSSNNRRGKMKS